jgi:carboxymethylenebutenolidase
VNGSTVDVPAPAGFADAYLVRPDDDYPHPGVLFIIDAYGLRARIEEMADRIAEQGYVVLAPNVFYRAGRAPVLPMPDMSDPQTRAQFMGSLRPLIAQLNAKAIAADASAYLDYLEQVAPGPAAITGYCMGARLGWRTAAAYPDRVIALAGFHGGRLVSDEPDSPHLSAGRLRAEVYFGHADQDPGMTPEDIATVDQALDDAGVPYRSEVYAGALHGYTMADTAVFNADACERHFTELFALLERAFGGEV